MQRLPKWMICDKFPAMYDLESATAIEQTAKVYGAMQTLIDEYNKFAERVNKIIDDFETYATKENEEFRVALRQEFQDFIDIINLKVKAQDKEINERFKAIVEDIEQRFTAQDEAIEKAVTEMLAEMRERLQAQDLSIAEAIAYMRDNVTTTVTEIIERMIDNGEIDETIANAFDSMSTRVNEIAETITTIQNDINNLNERINTLIEKDAEHDAEIEGLKKVDEELRDAVTIFTDVEGNAPLTIEDTKTGVIFDMEIMGRSDREEMVNIDKIMVFKKYNMVNPFLMVDEYTSNGGITFLKNPDGSYQRNGVSNSNSATWNNAVLYGVNSTSDADINNVMFEIKRGKYYIVNDCKLWISVYDTEQNKFITTYNMTSSWDIDTSLYYIGKSTDETYKGFGSIIGTQLTENQKVYCVGMSPALMRQVTSWENDIIYPTVIEIDPDDAFEGMQNGDVWKPYGDGAKIVDFSIFQNKPYLTPTTKICKRAGVWGIETDGNFEMFANNEFTPPIPLLQEEFNSLMVFDGDTVIDVHGTISGTDTFSNSHAKVKVTYMGNNQIALVLADLLARVTALENK